MLVDLKIIDLKNSRNDTYDWVVVNPFRIVALEIATHANNNQKAPQGRFC